MEWFVKSTARGSFLRAFGALIGQGYKNKSL